MALCNACVRIQTSPGRLSEPHYFFSISRPALRQQPWRVGTIYLLPGDTFDTQPRIAAGDTWVHTAQVASSVPVRPVAKLTVGPDDFPLLHEIRGHDDDLLTARAAADPNGFPWYTDA